MFESSTLSLAFLVLLVSLPLSGARDRQTDTAPLFTEVPGQREFSGRLIVRPKQPDALREIGMDATESARSAELARNLLGKYEVDEYVPQTDEYLVRVPEGSTENELSQRLMSYGVFQYAEPDWYVWPLACPDDTKFGNQWHHQATVMQSCAGWGLHSGLPFVSVGICDTGVRTTHEDLQLHRLEGYNAADRKWESQGGAIDSINPHGTLTTGCAAANGNNSKGVSGMGWNLSHRMLRVTNNPSGQARVADLQHAARTSIESGDRVASISYAGIEFVSNLTTATYIKSIGGLLVWAAGNDGRYTSFSQRDADDIIAVGATDASDLRASFSPYGPFVDVMSPGTNVYATGGNGDTIYGSGSGTSFATPLVSGLCALIWSANPSLSPDDVELVLKASCDDLGSPGVDNTFGYGRINVYTAMLLAGGGGGSPPTADFTGTPTSGTEPLTVAFTDTSTDAPTSWAWTFGDGATSTTRHPSHVYAAAGTYTVSLTATNDQGSDTRTRTNYITVDPGGGGVTGQGFKLSKNADFSTEDRTFTTNDTLHMYLWSDQVDYTNLVRNLWELKDANDQRNRGAFTNHGDGSFSASFALSGLASNATSWTWKAKVEDSTQSRYVPSTIVTVNTGGTPPTADFTGTPTSGTSPLTVAFTDTSTDDPTSWSWDFGDGGSATTRHPNHTYSMPGTYTVRLTATNDDGSDTRTRSNYITVDPPGGGVTGQGFLLSKNPDFSTNDRLFDRSDTLYMAVWSDQVDPSDLTKLEWRLRDDTFRVVWSDLTSLGNGIYWASTDLSLLPGPRTSWTWSAWIEDGSQVRFAPWAALTINL